MKSAVSFLLFQGVWFVAVASAADGRMWPGPLAAAACLAIHLGMIPGRRDRRRELGYALSVALAGSAVDTLLRAAGVTAYPTSATAWPVPTVPPWIASLWLAFATLPRFSLAWLVRRPELAAALGAVGGPLSYLAGSRFGSVAVGEDPALTWGVLAIEYAIVTPLLLHFAPATRITAGTAQRSRPSRGPARARSG